MTIAGSTIVTKVGRWIASQIRMAQERVDQHEKDLVVDPSGAMEHSDAVFTATCRLRLFTQIRSALNARGDEDYMVVFQRLVDRRRDRVMNIARSPVRSTSPIVNFMNQCDMVVHADFVEEAESFLRQ